MTHDRPQERNPGQGPPRPLGPTISRLLASPPGSATDEEPGVRALIRAAVFPGVALPPCIGRFVIRRMLGAGGMGIVYLAHDEVLDRGVAVKLLVTSTSGEPQIRARLHREAKIMAQLNHPNVVGVHEFGEHEGRFFVAMEYVEGRTLARWLDEERPSWRALLEVFIQAGRGLIAAHAAGIIHRDFKPTNVLVGDDGRVRVADFGLARNDLAEPGSTGTARTAGHSSRAPEFSIDVHTVTGQRLGTPAYMSPEQFRGAAVDARGDQFSFCVALWEALHGARPFPGDTVTALERNFDDHELAPRPANRKVPRWIDEVVARGLATDPDHRWPSMEAVISRLSRDPIRRRRRLGAAALALVVGGTAGYLVAATRSAPAADPCAAAEQRLAGVWDDARRSELERSLAASDLVFAREVSLRVSPALDDYARSWVDTYRDRCEGHARSEHSDTLHDQSMRCLAESRAALDATVTVLVAADTDTLANAVTLVAALPQVSRCTELELLQSSFRAPEDPALAAEFQRLRERLAELKVELEAGHVDHVRVELDALEPAVEASAAPAILLPFSRLRGRLAAAIPDWDAALEHYRRALGAAFTAREESQAMWLAAEIARDAALTTTRDGTLYDVHAQLARALAARGDEQLAVEVSLDVALAGHQQREGAMADAWATLQRAAERARALEDIDWSARLSAFMALGEAAALLGRSDECEAALREVLAIQVRHLGPWHPSQSAVLRLLGEVQSTSDPEAALVTLERAETLARALRKGASTFVWILKTRGVAMDHLGQLDDALATLREAAAMTERLPPDQQFIGINVGNSIGVLLDRLGRHAEARDQLAPLVEQVARALGPRDHEVAMVRLSLADALLHLGDTKAARREFAAAAAVWAELDPGGPFVVYADNSLGLVDLAEQRFPAARERLERVYRTREAGGASPEELASTRFGLAQVLSHSGEQARARALASLALSAYRELGPGYARDHDTVQAWLAARGVTAP